MEGYFPVSAYAKFEGISKDAAFHRYYRNDVPGFKHEDGRIFLYFNSKEKHPVPIAKCPEGFLPIAEYADINGENPACLRERILSGRIIPPDALVVPYGKQRKYYIRADYDCKATKYLHMQKNPAQIELYKNRPEGYLTVNEWIEKYGVKRNSASAYIYRGIIPSVKVEKHRYIHKDTKPPEGYTPGKVGRKEKVV